SSNPFHSLLRSRHPRGQRRITLLVRKCLSPDAHPHTRRDRRPQEAVDGASRRLTQS
ncbi:hypothetical protein EI94DRAFT_1711891, partial [Lactarius quietus]